MSPIWPRIEKKKRNRWVRERDTKNKIQNAPLNQTMQYILSLIINKQKNLQNCMKTAAHLWISVGRGTLGKVTLLGKIFYFDHHRGDRGNQQQQ